MEKINLKKLNIYCLYNKVTDVYDSFMLSNTDEEAIDYFLNQIANTAFEFANNADNMNYNRLFTGLKDTLFMRLSTFDEENGVFLQDKAVLIDYITSESIEGYIKAKFDLKNKFMDLVPKTDKSGDK